MGIIGLFHHLRLLHFKIPFQHLRHPLPLQPELTLTTTVKIPDTHFLFRPTARAQAQDFSSANHKHALPSLNRKLMTQGEKKCTEPFLVRICSSRTVHCPMDGYGGIFIWLDIWGMDCSVHSCIAFQLGYQAFLEFPLAT